MKNSAFVAALPLVLLLASTSTDYYIAIEGYNSVSYLTFDNLPTREEPDGVGRIEAETLKSKLQAPIYLLIILLAVLHSTRLVRFFLSIPILVLISVCLLSTAIQSFVPERVVANAVLVLINIFAAAIFAISQQGREMRLRNFYLVVFIPFFIHQVASLLLFLFVGLDIIDFIVNGNNRVGGFSGNPNSLSMQALVGIWSALSLLFSRKINRVIKYVCIFSLGVFFVNILMSGSGTGILVGTVVISLMVWFHMLSFFNSRSRVSINMLMISMVVLGAAVLVVFKTPNELFLATTDALGKESTLTGRTELWEVARLAVSEKFWFGWGYDYHESVFTSRSMEISLNHFHNGFLDTAVAGGVILVTLVLICFINFATRLVGEWQLDYMVYPLGVSFVMLVFLNLSEYTLLRPNSQVWLVFLCSLSYVVVSKARIGVLPEYLWVKSPTAPPLAYNRNRSANILASAQPKRKKRKRKRRSKEQ